MEKNTANNIFLNISKEKKATVHSKGHMFPTVFKDEEN